MARNFAAEWLRPSDPDHADPSLLDTLSTAMVAFYAVTSQAIERLSASASPHANGEGWNAFDGSLTIRFLQCINAKRAERWHGLKSWSALEWAGAMAGEAGEANGAVIELLSTLARFSRHVGETANAAKKLKRVEDGIANINLEDGRSLTDVENASSKIVDEIADTVIYGVLLAERVGMDLEEAIRMKFNRKSEEYGFHERIPPNQPPSALSASLDETQQPQEQK